MLFFFIEFNRLFDGFWLLSNFGDLKIIVPTPENIHFIVFWFLNIISNLSSSAILSRPSKTILILIFQRCILLQIIIILILLIIIFLIFNIFFSKIELFLTYNIIIILYLLLIIFLIFQFFVCKIKLFLLILNPRNFILGLKILIILVLRFVIFT